MDFFWECLNSTHFFSFDFITSQETYYGFNSFELQKSVKSEADCKSVILGDRSIKSLLKGLKILKGTVPDLSLKPMFVLNRGFS